MATEATRGGIMIQPVRNWWLCSVAAAVLLVLPGTCEAGPMSWRLCDDVARPVVVSGVVLTPDPPIIGTPANFLVSGTLQGETVESGTVDIDVSFGGVQIFGTSEDLCAKTTCPVAPGDIAVLLVEALPPIAPPGEYGLRVTGRDASGAELMCLDVDFELVLPSSSVLQVPGAAQAEGSKAIS